MACKKKYKIIAGIDEVGRGPLAGPVIAAAITIQPARQSLRLRPMAGGQFSIFSPSPRQLAWLRRASNFQFSNRCLKDSKKLSPKKREEVFEFLKKDPDVKWGIGRVSEKVIDRINIFQATKLSMQRAVKNLEKKIQKKSDFLLIDGNFGIDLPISQQSFIKGDERIFLIKLASIIAKVTRDRMMLRYHKKYPQYRFDRHKGYGTRIHFEMLQKYGPCKIHRKSFRPVSELWIMNYEL